MNSSPIISIVLPTYNRANLISETIESVINQSYTNWELIVIDDGSTDDTQKVVTSFQDSRIHYYFIEHSANLGKVRNEGIRKATGEFIAFLDSDDLWKPHKLERQHSLLQMHPQASFIFSNGDQFGENVTPTPVLENFFVGQIFHPFLLHGRFIYYVPSLLFRKDLLRKIPLLDEKLKSASDILFFLRMTNEVQGVFTNESMVQIRKHSHNHSNEMESVADDEYLSVLTILFAENRLSKQDHSFLKSKTLYQQGVNFLGSKDFQKARRKFFECLRHRPMRWRVWVRIMQTFI